MKIKFTPTQRNMLSVAAQREDRCLEPVPALKTSAVSAFSAKLIGAGVAREIRTKAVLPVWRRDQGTGQDYSLKLTALGGKIAAGLSESSGAPSTSRIRRASSLPRNNSKLSQVVAMLLKDGGTTAEEISKAMGWLPHTTRATLTGLDRKSTRLNSSHIPLSRMPSSA